MSVTFVGPAKECGNVTRMLDCRFWPTVVVPKITELTFVRLNTAGFGAGNTVAVTV